MTDGVHLGFEGSYRFKEQVSDRLAVYLHQVRDLFIVHSFKIFKENRFLLATWQLVQCGADLHLIFAVQFILLNFGFNRLVVRKLAYFVNVEQRMGSIVAAEFLKKLVTQRFQKVNGNKLNIDVLTLFPDMDQQLLNGIFNELFVGSKVAGVVEKSTILLVGELAKRETISGLCLLPEI